MNTSQPHEELYMPIESDENSDFRPTTSSAFRRTVSVAAMLLFGAFAQAGAPDFIEDFTSFNGVAGVDTTSPTDTSSNWAVIGGGQTSTASGFESDPSSYNGPGLAFDGDEAKAIIQDANFPGLGPTEHQVAFLVRFSAATAPLGTSDFVQVMGSVPTDFGFGNPALANYVIAVGHTTTSANGIIVFVPTSPLGVFQEFVIPATPDEWHKVVIQYEPSSTILSLNATIKVWVDPASSIATPDIDIPTGFTASFFGIGRLGRFAIGNASPTIIARPGKDDPKELTPATRTGSSRTKADAMAGWYGTAETRAGSLADAIEYFDSIEPSSAVDSWTQY